MHHYQSSNLLDCLLTSIQWMITQSVLQPRDYASGHPCHPDYPPHLTLPMLFPTLATQQTHQIIALQSQNQLLPMMLATSCLPLPMHKNDQHLHSLLSQVLQPEPSHNLFPPTTIFIIRNRYLSLTIHKLSGGKHKNWAWPSIT